jgi:hypothetical protein
MSIRNGVLGIAVAALCCGAFASSPAQARERERGHIVVRDVRQDWHGGRWVHDRHNGRLGWWWVVGASWYFYTQPHSFTVIQPVAQPVVVQQAPPVVVQQAPPVVVEQAPPAAPPVTPVIYYCRATGTNYPETMSCPGGWQTMTAQTPPLPSN